MQIFFCAKLREERHENIIQFFTHVRVSNTVFMLFEFIDDGELFDHIGARNFLMNSYLLRLFILQSSIMEWTDGKQSSSLSNCCVL